MTGPLAHLKVIDFSWVGAGSYTTRLLAEHGADVIKVESSTHLDSLRLGPPFAGDTRGVNRSGYFAERNANKRSITVNLKDPRGVEIVRTLLSDADVTANNFRPGVLDKLGLGYEDIRRVNPRIVYLSMSMQGAGGPDSTHVGYGMTIAAIAGMTHLSAQPGRYPVGTGTHYPDHVPNPAHAAVALLAAIRHQRRTDEGQLIEIAQTEPTVASLGPAVLEWTATGHEPEPLGNRHPLWSPHGLFPVAGHDRWLALAVRTDDEWRATCRVLHLDGPDGLTTLSQSERHERADEIETAVASKTSLAEGGRLVERLQATGVPAGLVATTADLIDHDPQLAARDHWVRLRHAEMGDTLYGRCPIRLSETPGVLDRAAPLLGEHTAEVLRERLHHDDETISELADAGVLD